VSSNGHHKWISRAVETYNYHANKLKDNRNWGLRDTARSLRRSLGSISEDVMLASWVKTHKIQMEKFKYAKDALVYVRERQRKLDESEIDAN